MTNSTTTTTPSLTERALKKLCRWIKKKYRNEPVSFEMTSVLCREKPSNQTIADIFKGDWYSGFPSRYNVQAGAINHFDFAVDPRVQWSDGVLEKGLKGTRVLELGPFEGYNTWQLQQLGAEHITAVENNKINYLKCLAVKEITGLNASFLLGDFIAYLEECVANKKTFDLVWASGVLYHQVEPLKLLGLITKVTDKFFIHTHYYDQSIMTANADLNGYFNSAGNRSAEYDGFKAPLYYRSYQKEIYDGAVYSGGPNSYSLWMEKKDIFQFLESKGFKHITIEVDDKKHNHGPGLCFLAERE